MQAVAMHSTGQMSPKARALWGQFWVAFLANSRTSLLLTCPSCQKNNREHGLGSARAKAGVWR